MTRSFRPFILLADDDPEDQEMLKEALLELAPETPVVCLWDGPEVLSYLDECLEKELPSLLILDYKMPVLNASEILDRLCSDARYANMPKVVWSSSNQPEHIKLCLERGAIKYFPKPNSAAELRAIAVQVINLLQGVAPASSDRV